MYPHTLKSGVRRGHHMQVPLGDTTQDTPVSGSPTTDDVSLRPTPTHDALSRTYSVLGSLYEPSLLTLAREGITISNDRTDDNTMQGLARAIAGLGDYDRTPITGLDFGNSLFRYIKPAVLSIPILDIPMSYDRWVSLKLRLDSSDGLNPTQVRELIGQCPGCDRFMWIRSGGFHRCQGKVAVFANVETDGDKLFSQLDSMGDGKGLTEDRFQFLFPSCVICGIMCSRTAAPQHSHPELEG